MITSRFLLLAAWLSALISAARAGSNVTVSTAATGGGFCGRLHWWDPVGYSPFWP